MRWLVAVLALASGCSKLLGIDDLTGPAAGPDASLADAGPVYRTLRGHVTKFSSAAEVGTIEAIAGGQSLAQATAAADGSYALQVPTDGGAFDVEVRVTDASATPAYNPHHAFYGPFTAADHDGIDVTLVTHSDLQAISSLLSIPIDPAAAQVVVEVRDAGNHAAAGAMVAAPSANAMLYYSSGGLPSSTPTATTSDGRAFLFNGELVTTAVTATGSVEATRTVSLAQGDIYEVVLRAGT